MMGVPLGTPKVLHLYFENEKSKKEKHKKSKKNHNTCTSHPLKKKGKNQIKITTHVYRIHERKKMKKNRIKNQHMYIASERKREKSNKNHDTHTSHPRKKKTKLK